MSQEVIKELVLTVRSLAEKIESTKSAGNLGSFASLNQGNNQNINNYFAFLHANPRNVELSPIRDFEKYYYILSFLAMFASVKLSIFIVHSLGIDIYKTFFFALLVVVLSVSSAFISAFSLNWMFKKFSWGHVKYKDRAFEYKGVKNKFYEDIWAVELKKGWMNKGRIEYFGIDPRTNKVYSVKLILLRYQDAKYLHDIFWSGYGRDEAG